MDRLQQFYINGAWVAPQGTQTLDLINPATEEALGVLSLGNAQDVDRAVRAAARAFSSSSSR